MPPRGGWHVDFEAFRIILWQLALQPPKTNGWNIKMNRCKRRFLLWTSSFSASISSMGKDHIAILGQKVIEAPQLDVISPWRRSNVRKSWELLNVPAKRLSTGSCERFREWCAVGKATHGPWDDMEFCRGSLCEMLDSKKWRVYSCFLRITLGCFNARCVGVRWRQGDGFYQSMISMGNQKSAFYTNSIEESIGFLKVIAP